MSDPKPLPDPAALLRRVVAAYDALQAAYGGEGNDPSFVQAAKDALAAAISDARSVTNAPQPWRREKSRRARSGASFTTKKA